MHVPPFTTGLRGYSFNLVIAAVILFLYRNEVYMFVRFRKERVSLPSYDNVCGSTIVLDPRRGSDPPTAINLATTARVAVALRVTGQGQLVRGWGSRRLARLCQSGEGPDPWPSPINFAFPRCPHFKYLATSSKLLSDREAWRPPSKLISDAEAIFA